MEDLKRHIKETIISSLELEDIRVGRGGSWLDSASVCAVSYRGDLDTHGRHYNRGFRLVRKAP